MSIQKQKEKKTKEVPWEERADIKKLTTQLEELNYYNLVVNALPTTSTLQKLISLKFQDSIERANDLKVMTYVETLMERHIPTEIFENEAEKTNICTIISQFFWVYRIKFQGLAGFTASKRFSVFFFNFS